jgi:probable addiction module antidote protein
VMSKTVKTYPFDAADYINTPDDVAAFLRAAFDEAFEANDPGFIAHALGVIARSKGMTQIAEKTGRSREQLYKSLSIEGNPTLATTLSVMRELGVKLTAEAA